jgi:hypothetical protein
MMKRIAYCLMWGVLGVAFSIATNAIGTWIALPQAQAQVPNGAATRRTAFQLTVPHAATPVSLSTATGAPHSARQVAITPLSGNATAHVEVRTVSTTAGFELQSGQPMVIPLNDKLDDIWIKVFSDGDKVGGFAWTD